MSTEPSNEHPKMECACDAPKSESLGDKLANWYYSVTDTTAEIKVESKSPEVKGPSYLKGEIKDYEMTQNGKYKVLVFYCKDYSIVCPKELVAFNEKFKSFQDNNAELIGISVDNVETHKKVSEATKENSGIGMLEYPLVADTTHKICKSFGVMSMTGVACRATIIVNPDNIVKYVQIHSLLFQRDTQAILDELIKLQKGDSK
ncbi:peroxiredoxin, putative [Entamoeba invadens IP1]|uniref:Peroxiredoxin, putative n=1 Tax=Entamoeba invadens IP1 TaxID=370355 RepID=A0A0A1U4A6_ENTIV|nr:peroxiredoxin, putative [Entamoeba invadens IP1]ELP89063.1 peroxiredoxin, putative [Entamoeba invadens IP1]|eukprot:XP_004255834.1 peroxiredoxin, putative [Entamoeba invadens IP1]